MLALMGLLPWTATITADTLRFAGKDLKTINKNELRKIIGSQMAMIFQEPMTSLNPCFTVGFQLTETLKIHLGMNRAERKKRAIELLDLVGIPEPQKRLSAFPHQLSGGMNQRVMIAMAISCNPRLLIADEPTTALDVTIQAQILDLLLKLQKEQGMSLVLITHDMGVVAETAERVAVQYAGQQVEKQQIKGLFAEPHHPVHPGVAEFPAGEIELQAAAVDCRRCARSIRQTGRLPVFPPLPVRNRVVPDDCTTRRLAGLWSRPLSLSAEKWHPDQLS